MSLRALRRAESFGAVSRYAYRLYSTKPPPGPLEGIRILDLTRVLAGPFCTQILSDYGAEIIKVEHPSGGDDTRLWRDEAETRFWKPGTKNTSLYFNGINRNKKSITLDIKHAKGRGVLLDLLRGSDVVVDNFIPGKLEGLGLGFEIFKKANPGIIHASISGYGSCGPSAQKPGYDMIAAAEAGLMHVTGSPDGQPTKPGVGLMDMSTGLYLHGAICAALVRKSRTGEAEAQKIDVSLFETTISILHNVGMGWLNLGLEGQRWGNSHATIVPYDTFRTKDSLLVIGAVNDRQYKSLCRRLGDEEVASDPRFDNNDERVKNRDALKEILERQFATKTTEEWMKAFEDSGLPHGPVNTIQQAFEHPQTAARGMIQTMEHSDAVDGKIRAMGAPVKFDDSQAAARSKPPGLGEHTDKILTESGYSKEEISRLRSEEVIVS